MADLEIKIKTSADTGAAKQTAEALAKLQTSAKGAAGSMGGLTEKLREVVPGFARLQDLATSLGTGALGLVAAGLAAIAAAAKIAASGVREYAEAQEQVTKLDAALAQSGNLTEAYREKLQALAGTLAEATAIADEQWLGVLARLTQFGAKPDNIEAYAEAVKNLAGIMGGDIEGAATTMTRAMGGSFAMFGRLGIHIKETGTQAEKMAELFEKVKIGAGQLEAATRTLGGQYRALKIAVSEVLEGIGGLIARTGILQVVLDAFGATVGRLAGALGGTVPQISGMANAVDGITRSTDEASTGMGKGKTAAEQYAEGIKKASDALARLSAEEEKRLSHEEKLDAIQMRMEMKRIDTQEKAGAARGGLSPIDAEVARVRTIKKYSDRKFSREEESRQFQAGAILSEADKLAAQIALKEKDDAAAAAYAAASKPAVEARKKERELLIESQLLQDEAGKATTQKRIRQALSLPFPVVGLAGQALGLDDGSGASAEATEAGQEATRQRRIAQDIQARIGAPPTPRSVPGFSAATAREAMTGLRDKARALGTEAQRAMEIKALEDRLNTLTGAAGITGHEIDSAEAGDKAAKKLGQPGSPASNMMKRLDEIERRLNLYGQLNPPETKRDVRTTVTDYQAMQRAYLQTGLSKETADLMALRDVNKAEYVQATRNLGSMLSDLVSTLTNEIKNVQSTVKNSTTREAGRRDRP